MKILLSTLKSAPDQKRDFEVEVNPPKDLEKFLDPAQVELTAIYTGDGILVSGHLTSTYSTYCSRCLEPVKKEINFDFQEEFRQLDKEVVGAQDDTKEVVLEEEELSVDYFSGHELDLTDFLRQMLILSIPFKTVCREKCQGLCPHCGTNLNQDKCECEDEDIDPRLSKLKQLKED